MPEVTSARRDRPIPAGATHALQAPEPGRWCGPTVSERRGSTRPARRGRISPGTWVGRRADSRCGMWHATARRRCLIAVVDGEGNMTGRARRCARHQHTCVTRRAEHRVRRGVSGTAKPAGPRSARRLAQPHGPSRPSHNGQERSPLASRRSTDPASASTVSTAPPSACTALPELRQEIDREGRSHL
jgi:hypothetical protein